MNDQRSELTRKLFDDGPGEAPEPRLVFEDWFAEACKTEINDPNAMTLATVDAEGRPDARIVLLNGRDAGGYVFFTNGQSAKGEQLKLSATAALVFHWKSQRRQVRIRGPVSVVDGSEADAYFATRARQSQIGAHASAQSRPLASRDVLLSRVTAFEKQIGSGPVPRPAHWQGYRVTPQTFEFWQDGAFRLHDRVRFERKADDAGWVRTRLNP